MRRSSTGSRRLPSAARIAPSASVDVRSISTSTDCHMQPQREADDEQATRRPAMASPAGSPVATRIVPASTASEPARSEAKWTAFAASAGEP